MRLKILSPMVSQICMQLEPYDLFNLTRTSRAFHRTLMSGDYYSRTLWRNSYDHNAKGIVPNRPSDLSEVAWVELLFGSGCQVRICLLYSCRNSKFNFQTCGRPVRACDISFALRRRICAICVLDRSAGTTSTN